MTTSEATLRSQLIENAFLHGPVDPSERLVVFEGTDGLAHILSAGTDNRLYLIRPDAGSETHWSQVDQHCPVTPTRVAALAGSDGRIHLAVADESTRKLATRTRSPQGDWSAWREILDDGTVATDVRFHQLELRELDDGAVELLLLYLQRFDDPDWQYTYRIGRGKLSGSTWGLGLSIQDRFTGWWPVNLPSMTLATAGTTHSLFLFIPESRTLIAWDGIDTDSPHERVVTTLASGFLPRILSLTHLEQTSIFAVGTVDGQSGFFRLEDGGFGQIGSVVGSGSLVHLAGTVDATGAFNLLGVDPAGGVWHTFADPGGAFLTPFKISDRAVRAAGTLTTGEGPVFVLTERDLQMSRYLRSPQTVDWQLEEVDVQTTKTEWAMWYNTRATVVDERGQAKPLAPVRLKAEETTLLTVNGATEVVGPLREIQLATDGNGLLSIQQPTRELDNLWVPKLEFQLEGDAPDTWRALEAATATRDRLYSLTGEELRKATGRNGASVLPPDAQPDADRLAAQISTCVSIGRQRPDHGLHTVPEYTGRIEDLPEEGTARFTRLDGSVGDPIDIQDLWEGVKEGVVGVVNLGIETIVNGGLVERLKVTIETAAGTFETVIRLVSQGFNVVRAIFAEVGVAVETALEWLGYLFDWDKILQRKDEIATMITTGIASVPTLLAESGIATRIPEVFASLRAEAPSGIDHMRQGIGRDSVGEAAASIDFTTIENVLGAIDDSVLVPANWLFDRLAPILRQASPFQAPLDGPAWTKTEAVFTDIQNHAAPVQSAVDDLTGVLNGVVTDGDPNGLGIDRIVGAFEPHIDAILGLFEQTATGSIAAIDALANEGALVALLQQPLELPLFGEILGLINGGTAPVAFSSLDLIATLAAIPTHFILVALETSMPAEFLTSTECGAWIAAGVFMILIGLVSAIAHALEEVHDAVAALVNLLWLGALAALGILLDWQEPLLVIAFVLYLMYQCNDLMITMLQQKKVGMAIYGVIIGLVMNILAAVYEGINRNTQKAVPPWQIVANHVGTLTDLARAADLIWRPPQTKPKPARVVLVIIDVLGMGSLAASAIADFHQCRTQHRLEEAAA